MCCAVHKISLQKGLPRSLYRRQAVRLTRDFPIFSFTLDEVPPVLRDLLQKKIMKRSHLID